MDYDWGCHSEIENDDGESRSVDEEVNFDYPPATTSSIERISRSL